MEQGSSSGISEKKEVIPCEQKRAIDVVEDVDLQDNIRYGAYLWTWELAIDEEDLEKREHFSTLFCHHCSP